MRSFISIVFPCLTSLLIPVRNASADIPRMIIVNEDQAAQTGLSNTAYDELFQDFSACLGIDWQILKVIAFQESGLHSNAENSLGHSGLFMLTPVMCRSVLDREPLDSEWLGRCGDMHDPVVNIAAATSILAQTIAAIDTSCGANIMLEDKILLLYLGHNSGPGMVMKALTHEFNFPVTQQERCSREFFQLGYIAAWNDPDPLSRRDDAEVRFEFARKVEALVLEHGVSEFAVMSERVCPLKSPPPPKATTK
jgi:hypothetical protein